jgi:hypothetical protein
VGGLDITAKEKKLVNVVVEKLKNKNVIFISVTNINKKMGLIDKYLREPPMTGKIDTNGTDKTPIENDGGLNLSADAGLLKTARGGEIGQGTPQGYNEKKKYSVVNTAR